MRKTLSLILSVLMVLAIASLGISAEGPEGTAVKTPEEFANMAVDGKYYLDADLVITQPYDKEFEGTLDGNGHTVTVSCPMFSIIKAGVVKNLKIAGTINANNEPAAGLAVRVVDSLEVYDSESAVTVSVKGNHQGLYAAGFVATTNVVAADNELWYDNKQPENNTTAMMTFIRCKNTGDISCVLEGIPEKDPDVGTDTKKTKSDGTASDYAIQEGTVKPRAGGFVAVGQDFIMVDCVNEGDVLVDGASSSIAGGLVARPSLASTVHTNYYINCVNKGSVTSNSYSGGIAGYINGSSGSAGVAYVFGCVNEGEITGPSFCGGIVGYMWASGATSYMDMEYCINTGKLNYGRPLNAEGKVQTSYASGWIAYTNSTSTTIRYCIDIVDRTILAGATEWSRAVICVSSANPMDYFMEDNYLIDANGFVTHFSHWNNDSKKPQNEANVHLIEEAGDKAFVLKDDSTLKSGEVAYKINDAMVKNYGTVNAYDAKYDSEELKIVDREFMYYQKIGVDSIPTLVYNEEAPNYVDLKDGVYVNTTKPAAVEETTPEATEPVTTPEDTADVTTPETTHGGDTPDTSKPADETTKATESGKKGCGGFAAAGVAVVALIGAAFVAKKKF